MPRADGIFGQQGEAACVIATMGHFAVREVEPGGLQALLQFCEVIRGADFTHAEHRGADGGEDLHAEDDEDDASEPCSWASGIGLDGGCGVHETESESALAVDEGEFDVEIFVEDEEIGL